MTLPFGTSNIIQKQVDGNWRITHVPARNRKLMHWLVTCHLFSLSGMQE